MSLLVLLIILIVLFGGFGFWGSGRYGNAVGWSPVGIIVFILVVLLLMGRI